MCADVLIQPSQVAHPDDFSNVFCYNIFTKEIRYHIKEDTLLRIYLDNCSYNRPYDDQTNMQVQLEAQAKLFIQSSIKDGKYEFVFIFFKFKGC